MCHFLFIKIAYTAFFLSCSIQDLINGYWFLRLSLCEEIKLFPIGHHFSGTVVCTATVLLSCEAVWCLKCKLSSSVPSAHTYQQGLYATEWKAVFSVVEVLAQFHKYTELWKWLPVQWWTELLLCLWTIPWVTDTELSFLPLWDSYILGFCFSLTQLEPQTVDYQCFCSISVLVESLWICHLGMAHYEQQPSLMQVSFLQVSLILPV